MLAKKEYTVIMRRSKFEYVAICLELNISASGVDLADTEKNLKDAIEAYLEDIKEYPETVVEPITVKELIEFLRDTEPEWHGKLGSTLYFRPLEVHEVPVYYEACIDDQDALKREKYLKTTWGKRYLNKRLENYLTG